MEADAKVQVTELQHFRLLKEDLFFPHPRPEDIQKADALPVDRLVLDSFSEASHGGTGTLAPWNIIKENRPQKPFFLAGGISAENVLEAIEAVQPFGVDVSSSVETDKHKDIDKIKQIIQIIKN